MYKPCHIETATGRLVDPLNLSADSVHLDDIAAGLRQPRFMAHTSLDTPPYTIASHLLMCLDILAFDHEISIHVQPALALHVLLHDAAEAYLLDVPSSLKHRICFLPDPNKDDLISYRTAEDNALQAIYAALGVPLPTDAQQRLVQDIDATALATEVTWFKHGYPTDDLWRITHKPSRILFSRGFGDYIHRLTDPPHSRWRNLVTNYLEQLSRQSETATIEARHESGDTPSPQPPQHQW